MVDLDDMDVMAEIVEIFDEVLGLLPSELMPVLEQTRGKLYEAHCVGRLLSELISRLQVTVFFTGATFKLSFGGGYPDPSDPHFELHNSNGLWARLYTDVWVATLGVGLAAQWGPHLGFGPVTDRSAYHEMDVALVRPTHASLPKPGEVILGLECKATADFDKAFVREALGRRRELSFLQLGQTIFGDDVLAHPASVYRVVFIDPHGLNYAKSPKVFGVDLEHWAVGP